MASVQLKKLRTYVGYGIKATKGIPIPVDEELAQALIGTGFFVRLGGTPEEAAPAPEDNKEPAGVDPDGGGDLDPKPNPEGGDPEPNTGTDPTQGVQPAPIMNARQKAAAAKASAEAAQT